jgi:hypothetical protein
LLEDRVVTTDQLLHVDSGTDGWCQLGPGILHELDPDGFHVLVPTGHLHANDDECLLSCMAELQVGGKGPFKIRVLLPLEMFEALPRAFDVLARIPATAAAVVAELEDWITEDTTADGRADDTAG